MGAASLNGYANQGGAPRTVGASYGTIHFSQRPQDWHGLIQILRDQLDAGRQFLDQEVELALAKMAV